MTYPEIKAALKGTAGELSAKAAVERVVRKRPDETIPTKLSDGRTGRVYLWCNIPGVGNVALVGGSDIEPTLYLMVPAASQDMPGDLILHAKGKRPELTAQRGPPQAPGQARSREVAVTSRQQPERILAAPVDARGRLDRREREPVQNPKVKKPQQVVVRAHITMANPGVTVVLPYVWVALNATLKSAGFAWMGQDKYWALRTSTAGDALKLAEKVAAALKSKLPASEGEVENLVLKTEDMLQVPVEAPLSIDVFAARKALKGQGAALSTVHLEFEPGAASPSGVTTKYVAKLTGGTITVKGTLAALGYGWDKPWAPKCWSKVIKAGEEQAAIAELTGAGVPLETPVMATEPPAPAPATFASAAKVGSVLTSIEEVAALPLGSLVATISLVNDASMVFLHVGQKTATDQLGEARIDGTNPVGILKLPEFYADENSAMQWCTVVLRVGGPPPTNPQILTPMIGKGAQDILGKLRLVPGALAEMLPFTSAAHFRAQAVKFLMPALQVADAQWASHAAKTLVTPAAPAKSLKSPWVMMDDPNYKPNLTRSYGALVTRVATSQAATAAKVEVLMVEPTNHYGGVHWTFPKGGQDAGEAPAETAAREVLEETGWGVTIKDPIAGPYEGVTTLTAYYHATPIQVMGTPDKETQTVEWVNFTDVPTRVALSTSGQARLRDLRAWVALGYHLGLFQPATFGELSADLPLVSEDGIVMRYSGSAWVNLMTDSIVDPAWLKTAKLRTPAPKVTKVKAKDEPTFHAPVEPDEEGPGGVGKDWPSGAVTGAVPTMGQLLYDQLQAKISANQITPKMGSNLGGRVTLATSDWYVKWPASDTCAVSEALALALYAFVTPGKGVPEFSWAMLVPPGGTKKRRAIVTRWLDGATPIGKSPTPQFTPAWWGRMFATALWLGNYDAIGEGHATPFDNVVSVNGKPYHIDAGASLWCSGTGSETKTGYKAFTPVDIKKQAKEWLEGKTVAGTFAHYVLPALKTGAGWSAFQDQVDLIATISQGDLLERAMWAGMSPVLIKDTLKVLQDRAAQMKDALPALGLFIANAVLSPAMPPIPAPPPPNVVPLGDRFSVIYGPGTAGSKAALVAAADAILKMDKAQIQAAGTKLGGSSEVYRLILPGVSPLIVVKFPRAIFKAVVDPDGNTRWANLAATEWATNGIYHRLGLAAPRMVVVEHPTLGPLTLSVYIPDLKSACPPTQETLEYMARTFLADAWLANWDVVGATCDNLMKLAPDHHVRIDNGGSLAYRAQGEPKAKGSNAWQWGPAVNEVYDMPGSSVTHGVYKLYPPTVPNLNLLAKIQETAAGAEIILLAAGFTPQTALTLTTVLQQRANWLTEYVKPKVEAAGGASVGTPPPVPAKAAPAPPAAPAPIPGVGVPGKIAAAWPKLMASWKSATPPTVTQAGWHAVQSMDELKALPDGTWVARTYVSGGGQLYLKSGAFLGWYGDDNIAEATPLNAFADAVQSMNLYAASASSGDSEKGKLPPKLAAVWPFPPPTWKKGVPLPLTGWTQVHSLDDLKALPINAWVAYVQGVSDPVQWYQKQPGGLKGLDGLETWGVVLGAFSAGTDSSFFFSLDGIEAAPTAPAPAPASAFAPGTPVTSEAMLDQFPLGTVLAVVDDAYGDGSKLDLIFVRLTPSGWMTCNKFGEPVDAGWLSKTLIWSSSVGLMVFTTIDPAGAFPVHALIAINPEAWADHDPVYVYTIKVT